MTDIQQVLKTANVPTFESIEGPFEDNFNGKQFYVGKIDGFEVKFDLKFVDYGRKRII